MTLITRPSSPTTGTRCMPLARRFATSLSVAPFLTGLNGFRREKSVGGGAGGARTRGQGREAGKKLAKGAVQERARDARS